MLKFIRITFNNTPLSISIEKNLDYIILAKYRRSTIEFRNSYGIFFKLLNLFINNGCIREELKVFSQIIFWL